eukprot:TRINITY_DN2415_c0_g1_i2.p1 TRINITY_DN2415_c0_g1~~TRINITY_DN2415_c0_g1_i2.p1  ORF type:complete len:825 (-),score=242.49 TRINITY_DN2415_c0_g1_i2:269-2743(-)
MAAIYIHQTPHPSADGGNASINEDTNIAPTKQTQEAKQVDLPKSLLPPRKARKQQHPAQSTELLLSRPAEEPATQVSIPASQELRRVREEAFVQGSASDSQAFQTQVQLSQKSCPPFSQPASEDLPPSQWVAASEWVPPTQQVPTPGLTPTRRAQPKSFEEWVALGQETAAAVVAHGATRKAAAATPSARSSRSDQAFGEQASQRSKQGSLLGRSRASTQSPAPTQEVPGTQEVAPPSESLPAATQDLPAPTQELAPATQELPSSQYDKTPPPAPKKRRSSAQDLLPATQASQELAAPTQELPASQAAQTPPPGSQKRPAFVEELPANFFEAPTGTQELPVPSRQLSEASCKHRPRMPGTPAAARQRRLSEDAAASYARTPEASKRRRTDAAASEVKAAAGRGRRRQTPVPSQDLGEDIVEGADANQGAIEAVASMPPPPLPGRLTASRPPAAKSFAELVKRGLELSGRELDIPESKPVYPEDEREDANKEEETLPEAGAATPEPRAAESPASLNLSPPRVHEGSAIELQPLVGGCDSKAIEDDAIIASSYLHDAPERGLGEMWRCRLDNHETAWCAGFNDRDQWVQWDFGCKRIVTKVQTKGRYDEEQWVRRFDLSYSQDGETWLQLLQDFEGNSDRDTLVENDIIPPIRARMIRLHPLEWHNRISMRAEFLGPAALPTPTPSQLVLLDAPAASDAAPLGGEETPKGDVPMPETPPALLHGQAAARFSVASSKLADAAAVAEAGGSLAQLLEKLVPSAAPEISSVLPEITAILQPEAATTREKQLQLVAEKIAATEAAARREVMRAERVVAVFRALQSLLELQ